VSEIAPVPQPGANRIVHLHLVSDSTGETIYRVARACMVQFSGIDTQEHVWSLVRSRTHLDKVMAGIASHPGPVMFTLVEDALRIALQERCRQIGVPLIPILDPVIGALASYLGMPSNAQPGKQHNLDAEYFSRIDAMTFAMAHDDGQSTRSLNDADIVLVGVSRTSKTPTCMYLANRGIKAANVPLVPGLPIPAPLLAATKPFIVGLTNDPSRLIQLRRNRLNQLAQDEETDYVDVEAVKREVAQARRLFTEHNWPVIDVTRRSIEETAAAILTLYTQHRFNDN
jgi:[pyruvate, water dikinase]-phosphate phosphotransferase / [pyruvate, water dikinase] kinase